MYAKMLITAFGCCSALFATLSQGFSYTVQAGEPAGGAGFATSRLQIQSWAYTHPQAVMTAFVGTDPDKVTPNLRQLKYFFGQPLTCLDTLQQYVQATAEAAVHEAQAWSHVTHAGQQVHFEKTTWLVFHPASAAPIGILALGEYEAYPQMVLLSVSLQPEFQGQGLASELLAGLFPFLQSHTDIHTLMWGFHQENPASAQLAQRYFSLPQPLHGAPGMWASYRHLQ